MEYQAFIFPTTVIIAAFVCRLPFLNFPLDDDFSIYTYRARFAKRGFKWKEDLQLIGNPFWKMPLLDMLYSYPEKGPQRLRWLQTAFHILSALAVYYASWSFTQNLTAALVAGLLYSLYGTSPDLTAGSFNFEQFYIPFVLVGLVTLMSGPESIFFAGLFFGLASLAKITALIYALAMMPLVALNYNLPLALIMSLGAILPVCLSSLADWKLGYLDKTSRKQNGTRLATTLRLVKTKQMYSSIPRELGLIIKQTIPLWIASLPALALIMFSGTHMFLTAFIGITITMMVAQRTFSRYHYLPWIAVLSIGAGFGVDSFLNPTNLINWLWLGLFIVSLVWNLEYLAPYYFRPVHNNTLIRYEKFDQYLYLPHLSRQVKRLARMRGESNERIYVWGTFSQIYHMTGLPASDNYLHHSIGPWDHPSLQGFFDSVIGGLLKHKPIYLIKSFQDLNMQLLEEITGLRYRLVKVVLIRFPVYRLVAITSIPTDPMALPFLEKMKTMEALTFNQRHAPGVNREDFYNGRINTAMAQCKKLLRLNPKDIDGWDFLGESHALLRNSDESSSCYQKVLELTSHRPKTRLWLALQRIQQNRLDEAKKLVDEETKRFKHNTEVSYLKAKIHLEEKKYEEAIDILDSVLAEFPGRVDCWEWLIQALSQLKDILRLKMLYEKTKAIELKNDREWVQTHLITKLASLQNEQQPEYETINEFLKNNPENALLHYALASALERAGRLDLAIKTFEQVASNIKNYPHIQANAWFRLGCLSSGIKKEQSLRNCLVLVSNHDGAKRLLAEIKSVAT